MIYDTLRLRYYGLIIFGDTYGDDTGLVFSRQFAVRYCLLTSSSGRDWQFQGVVTIYYKLLQLGEKVLSLPSLVRFNETLL
jgi:hypothetical protein